MDRKELIEALERATGGDRELDVKIHTTVLDDAPYSVPAYTSSIDAALTLVPEGWQWGKRYDADGTFMECYPPDYLETVAYKGALGDTRTYCGTRSLREDPIALCLAALRAREEQ